MELILRTDWEAAHSRAMGRRVLKSIDGPIKIKIFLLDVSIWQ